jgi:polyisoprenoid-binding protein YceI
MTTETTTIETDRLAGTYRLDPTHTRLGFVARHAMVTKVRGAFTDFEGEITVDPTDPGAASASVTIQAKSVDTRNADRDAHLRSNDFFAMDEYPTVAFQSTGVERVGDDEFRVTGDLTVKDVTKQISFDVEYTGAVVDPWGNVRIGFEGSTTVNRKDWGLTWNAPLEAGGVLVSEKVTIEFDVSAVKAE